MIKEMYESKKNKKRAKEIKNAQRTDPTEPFGQECMAVTKEQIKAISDLPIEEDFLSHNFSYY